MRGRSSTRCSPAASRSARCKRRSRSFTARRGNAMKRSLACAFLLVASGALAAEPEGDLKALQGTWVLAEANLAGRDHLDDFKGIKLSVSGENYVIDFGKNSDKGTLKLDAAKKPKQIDLTTQ